LGITGASIRSAAEIATCVAGFVARLLVLIDTGGYFVETALVLNVTCIVATVADGSANGPAFVICYVAVGFASVSVFHADAVETTFCLVDVTMSSARRAGELASVSAIVPGRFT
jgi:hypothetical protein